MRNLLHSLVRVVIGTLLASASVSAQDGKALFAENCAPCHTIGGGPGIGPDLRDLGRRRNSDWVVQFVADPEAVTKSGDAYAAALAKQYDGTIMPPVALNRDAVGAILQYIAAQSSQAGAAAPVPAAPSEPAFTREDVSRGRALFVGMARLSAGGPACMSCHAAGSEPGFGGGALGPNLARAARRLNGAKGMTAWLASPPTPVMRSVFRRAPLTAGEVTALTAFFSDRAIDEAAPGVQRAFLVSGIAVAMALLFLIGWAWRGRLRPVRRAVIVGTNAARRVNPPHTNGFRSGDLR